MKIFIYIYSFLLMTNLVYSAEAPKLIFLSSGSAPGISYSLYQLPSPAGFLLTIHNTGAKFIDIQNLEKEDFEFVDDRGVTVAASFILPPVGIPYDAYEIIRISPVVSLSLERKYSLRLKRNPNHFFDYSFTSPTFTIIKKPQQDR